MATPKQIVFSFKEIAEILVREQKEIKEGHWGIFVRFGLQATNIIDSDDRALPAAIVPIVEMGLQPFEKPSSMTVDAAEVRTKYDGK
jgi:ribosomal protein L14